MSLQCTSEQNFGQNANGSYAAAGYAGHTGWDAHCGFGTPGHALYSGIAYKILSKNRPANDGTGFTGVFTIVDDGVECFEFLYGHGNPTVSEGDAVHGPEDGNLGDVIYTEANNGKVYSQGVEITLKMQRDGDTRGSHRHLQKRPLMPVTTTSIFGTYLTAYGPQNSNILYRASGFYYQVWAPNNGYAGCVNPLRPTFYRDLTIGSSGYDVWVLQRLLRRKGFFTANPTGYFGPFTALAVAAYQRSLGVTPTSYFGPISRSWALRELMPLPGLSTQ